MVSKADQELDALIDEITGATADDSTAMAAFHEAIERHLRVPLLAHALGRRVQVEGSEYESSRRGIVARIRLDGRPWRVAFLDVLVPGKSMGAKLVRAYQRWAGVEPQSAPPETGATVSAEPAVVEAAVLEVGQNTARIRPFGADEEVTLRSSGFALLEIVPGQVIRIAPKKRWRHHRYAYMSGTIESARIDIPALGLEPLALQELGPLDLSDGEFHLEELMELWSKAIAKPKVAYELEQVIPGIDETNWEEDPISDAVELRWRGRRDEAEQILMGLLHLDLRCVTAHALLGNWVLDDDYAPLVDKAIAHYEVGVGIVGQALGDDFDGFLPWGLSNNRPYLRCLHGYGRALWSSRRNDEALRIFEQVYCLDPESQTGAGLCWHAIKQGRSLEDWNDEPY